MNVSEREILNLPVNGRQMSQLMQQAPGAQNAGTGTWNDVRFAGRANQQNAIRFDGVEASAIIDSAPGNIGGLVRANSATNGRALIYDPYSLAVSNTATFVRGSHLAKIGGEIRAIRMRGDQRYGTT